MNIFTILRYPIDITFRIEDLERIPTTVVEDWWAYAQSHLYAHDNRSRIPCEITRIHAYMNNSTRLDVREKLLRKLKKMIDEHEELYSILSPR